MGVLTSRDRDTWAKIRNDIESTDYTTAQSLRVIDSSLFMVCLDSTSPNNLTEASYNFLGGTSEINPETGAQVGTCLNRWYDKTLQLAICENGVAGVIFEHSRVDGHTVLRYSSDIITDSIMRFAQSIRGGLPTVLTGLNHGDIGKKKMHRCRSWVLIVFPQLVAGMDSTPKRIQWKLAPKVCFSMQKAEALLSDMINQTEIEAVEFLSFGKQAIKEVKMSPDAFVQIAIQLAYYR